MNLPDPTFFNEKQSRIFSQHESQLAKAKGKELPADQKAGIRAGKSRWSWKGRSIQYEKGKFINRNSALKFFRRQGIDLETDFLGFVSNKEILKKLRVFLLQNPINRALEQPPIADSNIQTKAFDPAFAVRSVK